VYTLLLADDSVTIQRVIELTFADEDVQVIAVSDGDQAIARLESAPPDIVLADIGMPGRNGYEVARYVKQSPKLAHIPVVLLTGAFEPVDQVRAAEVGCDGVLAKPFEPQLVIGRVKELLSGHGKKGAAFTASAASADLDDYFERLDVAFSSLSSEAGTPDQFVASLPEPPTGNEIESFASEHQPYAATPPADPPRAAVTVPPAAAEAERAPAVTERPRAVAESAPLRPPRTELPSIGDAFAAILAAERQAPTPLARPAWPTPAVVNATTPDPNVSDELVERIARQVLDRLSDRVVREQVSGIVTAVAERLVREEIERIKSSIK
jgi:CheY-like chemotaxis protein